MQAYHDKQEIKEEYLARVRAHAATDEIIKGQYWENGRGCAVGCTIHSGNHQDYETLLGIPITLAYLEDVIFENLHLTKAKKWPELFLSSIEVGADLSLVFSKFIVRVLGDIERGCIIHAKSQGSQAAINLVIKLYERKIAGDAVSVEEWELAKTFARAAKRLATPDDATGAGATDAAGAFAAHATAITGVGTATHATGAAAEVAAFAASDAADAAARDAYATYVRAARAARAAATHATGAAADIASRAAADAYDDASRAAADAAAAAADVEVAARASHYEWMSDILIEELKNAK